METNMNHRIRYLAVAALATLSFAAAAQPKDIINPPPTAKDWADIAKLPDWSVKSL